MTNATILELNFLDWMACHEMTCTNGGIPECPSDMNTYLWLDDAAKSLKISVNAAKGVAGSCAKKGFVNICTEPNPNDSTVNATVLGFNTWKREFMLDAGNA